MSKRFPLMDGTELDLDERLDATPEVSHTTAVELREDFAEGSLPWWLSYVTDNGPASETIEGLATSGGGTVVKLDTGSTSTDDATALQGPTINWDNWSEVRAYVWGTTVDSVDSRVRLTLGDNKDPNEITEGFKMGSYQNVNISGRVISGGTSQNQFSNPNKDGTNVHSYGFRIYENETGGGHSIDFVIDGEHQDSWAESKGWPPAQDLTFHISVVTTNGTPAVASADGVLIELVP